MLTAASVAVCVVFTQGFSTASGGLANVTSDSASGHRLGGRPGQALSPREFRLTTERLLGHHAVLAAWLMRAPADVASGSDAEGFADAGRAELRRNTRELVDAVASVHGAKAGAQFAALWQARLAALEAYGTGRAAAD